MTPSTEPIDTLATLIKSAKFHYVTEADLQLGIAKLLEAVDIPFEREHVLDQYSRIDFLVDDIGIEVKVGFSGPAVWRQLRRYAKHDRIAGLILVTTRTRHRTGHVGHTVQLGGVPVRIAWLGLQAT